MNLTTLLLSDLSAEIMLFLFWFLLTICIFLSWHFYQRARNKERLLLIEKGIDVNEHFKKEREPQASSPWLKLGIIVIGLSIGLGIIAVIMTMYGEHLLGTPLPFAILGLSGGGSMIVAHYVSQKKP